MTCLSFEQALALHHQGALDAARDVYLSILQREPREINSLNLLGVLCCQQGRYEEGFRYLRKCLRLRPDFASAHSNLGNALTELGRYEEACQALKRAVALEPSCAEGHFNLSGVMLRTGGFAAALDHARKTRSLCPLHVGAQLAEGMALHALGMHEQALFAYQGYLAGVGGGNAQGHYQLARLHHDCGNFQAAFDSYQVSLQLDSAQAQANNDFGMLLCELGREPEALPFFRSAVIQKHDFAEALSNLGVTLELLGDYRASNEAHQKALAINPKLGFVQSNFAGFLQSLGKIPEAERAYLAARKLEPKNPAFLSHLLFAYNYSPDYAPAFLKEQADAYGRLVSLLASEPYSEWNVERVRDKKLRVGFVSGDLRRHPVGYFIEAVLASIDNKNIELVAYVTHPREDVMTLRLKRNFSQWRSLVCLNDKVAASLIHSDSIDILIDLSGHGAANRLPVFAWKPAPVQMTWLGYFATTGVTQIDYVLTDSHVFMHDSEKLFVERPCFLPQSYFCFSPPDQEVAVSASPALQRGFVTFGCFSNFAKVTNEVLDLWAKVLAAIPNAQLLLKAKQLADDAERLSVLSRLISRGISEERISFEGMSNRREYFERYSEVDIMLDTFPFPGGTTTAESLWMGVPVLAIKSHSSLGCQGVSILSAAGMDDWIAEGAEDYVAMAVSRAGDAAGLAALRAKLREQVYRSALMDGKAFSEGLETVWRNVWKEWLCKVG